MNSAFRIPHSAFRIPPTVIALGLVSLFNDASSEIIYPLLPLFVTTTLGASVVSLGLIEGLAESTASVLKLCAGWFSDRTGHRKPLVVGGYAAAGLMRPLLALATAGWHVLGLRFLDRIGKGVRAAPRDAMIADAVSADRRGLAFGFHRAMDHAGAIVGSLLAAWLVMVFRSDYRKIFLASTIPAAIALLILLVFVREPVRATPPADSRAPLPALSLRGFHRDYKIFLGILVLFSLTCSSDAFLLLRARQCGVGDAQIPLLWAWLHVSKTISSIIGGGMSDRIGRRPLIIAGWVLYAAIYGGFAVVETPAWIWTLFTIYGVYFGCTEGVEKALVADLVPADQRGMAFGWYNLALGISALPASLFLGFLWDRAGAGPALGASAVVSLIAAALLLFFAPRSLASAS
ncbi:MAG: MFS transporter [Blastocatellia bacterium]